MAALSGVRVAEEASAAAADLSDLAALSRSDGITPRDRMTNYERMLARSRELRCRVGRIGPLNSLTASLAASAAAARAASAATSMHRVAAVAAEDARTTRARKRLLHHESAAQEVDDSDPVAAEMSDLIDLSATLLAARRAAVGRLSSGRSKAGLSVDFTAGGPHQLRHRAAWASLEPGNAVMEIVRNRIRWPFNSHGRHAVTPQRVPNHKSAMATEKPPGCTEQLSPVDWITQAVTELEVTSIVRRVDSDDVVLCCALSMALKSSGKYRLCLDLRTINIFKNPA